MLKFQIGKMRAARAGGTPWAYVTHGGEELRVKVQVAENGVYLVFDAPLSFNIAREKARSKQATR